MSQFLLFTSNSLKSNNSSFVNVLNIEFNRVLLEQNARVLFGENYDLNDIYTIDGFDQICMDAQKSIVSGQGIRTTKLYSLLSLFEYEEAFFWYSSELNELDEVDSFDDLIDYLERELVKSAGEIYLHYLPKS